MVKKIFDSYKSFERITCKILKSGLEFCLLLCVLSVSILLTYNLLIPSPMVYYIGISLFKLSLIFGIEFIICGFVTDGIKKQLI
ncbi:MAG: hypothetical protein HFJ37_06190 [Clostridia bacterium]|nr:hypothetical protein [Clostridia bacterium]